MGDANNIVIQIGKFTPAQTVYCGDVKANSMNVSLYYMDKTRRYRILHSNETGAFWDNILLGFLLITSLW